MARWMGLVRHEFAMSIGRRGLWVAFGLLFAFHTVLLFTPPPLGEWVRGEVIARRDAWSVAGRFLAAVNVFFPVVAGILAADRLRRDVRSGMRELQESTPLGRPSYVLGKYAGVLASFLLPVLAWVMAIALVMVADGHAPLAFLAAVPAAFLAITVPAFAFVVAFSLACPLVMPLAVYQILFTGYWFWANFVPPRLFPTLNGTLLTPGGMFALQGFFGGRVATAFQRPDGAAAATPATLATLATLNLAVLAACVAAVLILVERLLRRRALRA
jgi:hypothetical protein